MYEETRAALVKLGLPSIDEIPTSQGTKRFTDGAQVRVEIPSCEGPQVLQAILEESERLQVPVHRVSQGSGIMLQTDQEIREMVKLGSEAGIEVSLFIGPRAGWHLSPLAKSQSGANVENRAIGADMVAHSMEDLRRAYGLGIRSVLVADMGLLWVFGELRRTGDLPNDMRYKASASMGVTNPATALVLERFGADTINVATDLSVSQLASIRAATRVPIDVYVEVPDDVGGFVRYYDIPYLIQFCSPLYMKYGVRNAPSIYPSGAHLKDVAVNLGKERVRRARIGQEFMERHYPQVKISQVRVRYEDLAVPVV